MKRKVLYSRATKRRLPGAERADSSVLLSDWAPQAPSWRHLAWQRAEILARRHSHGLTLALAVIATLAILAGWRLLNPAPPAPTQGDIDNAVRYTLSHTPPGPADATVAAATVAPSVVRVDGYLSPEHAAELAKAEEDAQRKAEHGKSPSPPVPPKPAGEDHPDSTGTGVVIDEAGDILTNLHVIRSTDRWMITFADGSKSEAMVQSVQPQDDLAVIRATKVPDELKPATLASTADLNPGDTVVAVGFPFGIGPSVSAGVVAGLKREFDDPDRKPEDGGKMTNLIQFDAAVNPGNSGGPLVNRDGEVVGIVTALYNPTGDHVFAGMAFAVPIENAARAVGQNPL